MARKLKPYNIDIESYLSRIAYIGNIEPSFDALRRLHRAHVLTVPFENLDIQYGIPIHLNLESLFNKVINQRRGGFCFELNGLFYELLKGFGFEVRLISAQVYSKDSQLGAPFDHAAIIVSIEEDEFLVDVGYGEFAIEPLKIVLNETIWDERGRFMMEEFAENQILVARLDHAKKKNEYVFDLKGHELTDFEEMCYYHQTSPNSPFTQRKLITIPTQNGRYTLTSDKFLYKIGIRTKIESIAGEDAFLQKLELIFGRSFADCFEPLLVRK